MYALRNVLYWHMLYCLYRLLDIERSRINSFFASSIWIIYRRDETVWQLTMFIFCSHYFEISPAIKLVFDQIQYWHSKHTWPSVQLDDIQKLRYKIWCLNAAECVRARERERERERPIDWEECKHEPLLISFVWILARDVNDMARHFVYFCLSFFVVLVKIKQSNTSQFLIWRESQLMQLPDAVWLAKGQADELN